MASVQTPDSHNPHETARCIADGGSAGTLLPLLLARQAVPVTLLESRLNFERDFRGDTPRLIDLSRLTTPSPYMRRVIAPALCGSSSFRRALSVRLAPRLPLLRRVPAALVACRPTQVYGEEKA